MTFIGHEAWIQNAAFSPDGTLFATISGDTTAKIWDLQGTLDDGEGRLLHMIEGIDWGSGISFSPDGLSLIARRSGQRVVWNVASGEEIMTLDLADRNSGAIAFSPDGKYLVQGTNALQSQPAFIHVRDLVTGEILSTVNGSTGSDINGLAFSPDGNLVVSKTETEGLRVWRFVPEGLLEIITVPGPARVAFFSPDGRLVTVSQDATVRFWDITPAGNAELTAITGGGVFDGLIKDAVFMAGGAQLVTVGNDGLIRLWDTRTWEEVQQIQAHDDGLATAAISTDNRYLAVGIDREGEALTQIWDTADWQLLHVLAGHEPMPGYFKGIMDVAFSPGGELLATAGADSLVNIWDITSGERLFTLDGHEGGWVLQVAFSADGKLLATSGQNWMVNVWDVTTGERLQSMSYGGPRTSWGLHFSPDSYHVLLGDSQGVSAIWSLPDDPWKAQNEEPQFLFSIPTDAGWIFAARFSPDGRQIALAGDGGLVEIRDAGTGELIQSLTTPSWIGELGYSPDGKRLITVGQQDGIARVFTLDLADLIKLAQSRVTRSLTDEECRQYLHLEACPVDDERLNNASGE